MARGRIIGKSISNSRKINSVSDRAALLFTWIQPHTDDYGRIEGGADDILFLVVPRRGWSEQEIEEMLKDLWTVGVIKTYTVEKKRYLEVVNFDEYQTLRKDRKKVATCPVPTVYDNEWFTNVIPLSPNVIVSEVKLSRSKGKVSKGSAQKEPISGGKDVEKTEPAVKELIDFFFKATKVIQHVQPIINGGQIGKLLKKRFEEGISQDRIEKMIIWYLTRKKRYQDEKQNWHEVYKNTPDFGVMLSNAFFNQLLSDEVNALTYMQDNMKNVEGIYQRIYKEDPKSVEKSSNVSILLKELTAKMTLAK